MRVPKLWKLMMVFVGCMVYGQHGWAEEQPEHHYTLDAGWNLVAFPFAPESDVSAILKHHATEVFPATVAEPMGELGEGWDGRVDHHRPYWVHAERAITLSFKGFRKNESRVAPSTGKPGWQAFHVFQMLTNTDPKMTRVLQWVSHEQRYRTLGPEETLRPGQGYFGHLTFDGPLFAFSHETTQAVGAAHPSQNRDLTEPQLTVLRPSAKILYTADPWLRIEGHVDDTNLQGLYLNGVHVGAANRSFAHLLSLSPGVNDVEVLALDEAQNRSIITRRVVFDPNPPVFELSASTPTSDTAVELEVHIDEPHLFGLWVDNKPVTTGPSFVKRWSIESTPFGTSYFSMTAVDRAHNRAEKMVAVYRDEQGIMVLLEGLPQKEDGPTSSPRAIAHPSFRATTDQGFETPSISPLRLDLDSPEEALSYTDQSGLRISGTTHSVEPIMLTVNGLLVTTATGAFSIPIQLKPGRTEIVVRAEAQAHERRQQSRVVIYDADAPHIAILGPQEQTVYEEQVLVQGTLDEAHLESLRIRKTGSLLAGTPIEVENGRFSVSLPLDPGTNTWTLEAVDRAKNISREKLVFGYALDPVLEKPPMPPTELLGSEADKEVHLVWHPPAALADGEPLPARAPLYYRVHREEITHHGVVEATAPLAETEDHRFLETLPAYGVYRYFITAVAKNATGQELESARSQSVEVRALEPSPVLLSGEFESPAFVTSSALNARLPRSTATQDGSKTLIHLGFVARGADDQRDRIEVLRSEKNGAPGSFAPIGTKPVFEVESGWTVTSLDIASHDKKLSVAWTERSDQSPPRFRIRLRSLRGETFETTPWDEATSTRYKRDVRIALDRFGQHHMVWSEANKIYYARNHRREWDAQGHPLNVFDRRRRIPATEEVKYLVKYDPDPDCDCPDCWCEESYPMSQELNPKDGLRPYGSTIDWWEDSYVYTPALHVSDNTVSIIAHQSKNWDGSPVDNPGWVSMRTTPVFSETIVQRKQPTRLVVGWREAWKDAYEPGDEALWDTLGIRYQYRYRGTWHHEDSIQLAQRPLDDGPPSEAHPEGEKGGPKEGDRNRWHYQVVDTFAPSRPERPSYPELAEGPSGVLYTVFEKGPSTDPNRPGAGALFIAASQNGGKSWNAPKALVAQKIQLKGYMPSIAVNALGKIGVAFYQPETQGPNSGGVLLVAESEDQADTWTTQIVNTDRKSQRRHPVKRLHPSRSETQELQDPSSYAPTVPGAPQLLALEELFFSAFIREPIAPSDSDRLMSTRASSDTTTQKLSIEVEAHHAGANKPVPVRLRIVNKHDIKVHEEPSDLTLPQVAELLPGALATGVASSVAADLMQAEDSTPHSIAPLAIDAALQSSSTVPLNFSQGEAVLTVSPTTEQGFVLPARDRGKHKPSNYQKAIMANHTMIRRTTLEPGGAAPYFYKDHHPPMNSDGAYQVEYSGGPEGIDPMEAEALQDPTFKASDSDQDAKYLARFERVWAYTLGIALAQHARGQGGTTRGAEAHHTTRALARYLCAHAVVDPQDPSKLRGWHFSWNTKGDDWRDARLVTGASAWALHGIGSFITSEAFQTLPSEAEKTWFKGCYHGALNGLRDHRRAHTMKDGRVVSLMTAGWTTEGLKHAHAPHRVFGDNRHASATNPQEQWAYYSILDAIGYPNYNEPTEIQVCVEGRAQSCASQSRTSSVWRLQAIDEKTWKALKRPTMAENVVTEHLLDTLSVLNHALDHRSELGLADQESTLSQWRNEVRDAVFYSLWDEAGGREELRQALEADNARPKNARALDAEKRRWIHEATAAGRSSSVGRVVTGGTIDAKGHFQISPHTAIDNCSWLALSVNHGALKASSDSVYLDRLEQCLQYTVVRFAKNLGYDKTACHADACPPRTTYYGTHYFQNDFKDPYILPSNLQESSYHLEATMGLIGGLLQFAEAHPERASSDRFQGEALKLWAGAQAFVRDHGFPYSSQRIQDLSTRLQSSTAIIWFIDVHELFKARDGDLDQSLKNYAHDVDFDALGDHYENAWQKLQGAKTSPEAQDSASATEPRAPNEASTLALTPRAFALVVAANRAHQSEEDRATATRWLKALLESAVYQDDEVDGLIVPTIRFFENGQAESGTDAEPFHDLAAEMWVHYALAYTLAKLEDPALDDAYPLITSGMRSLVRKAFAQKGPTRGLFTRNPPGAEPEAYIEDNVAAYFALKAQGTGSWEGPFAEERNQLANHIAVRLLARCGESGQKGIQDTLLCALFAKDIGDVDLASALLDRAYLARSQEEYAEDHPWMEQILFPLVSRALASLDPRQNALAAVELARLSTSTDAPPPPLAILIASNPQGAFGVQAGPIVVHPSLKSFPGATKGRGSLLRHRIVNPFLSTLGALLASDFQVQRFDRLFIDLLRLRLVGMVSATSSSGPLEPHRWLEAIDTMSYESLVRSTVHDLSTLCQANAKHFRIERTELEAHLGIPCDLAQSTFAHLLRTREGPEAGALAQLLAYDPRDEAWAMARLAERLTSGQDDEALFLRLQTAPPLSLHASASPSEVKEGLRERLERALDTDRAPAETASEPALAAGLGPAQTDPIDAFHPASPYYYTVASVALRGSREPPTPAQSKGTQSIRRFINQVADGNLTWLATAAELEPGWLHQSLQRGALRTRDFVRLTSALGLSDATTDAHQEQLKEALQRSNDPWLSLLSSPAATALASGSDFSNLTLVQGISDPGSTTPHTLPWNAYGLHKDAANFRAPTEVEEDRTREPCDLFINLNCFFGFSTPGGAEVVVEPAVPLLLAFSDGDPTKDNHKGTFQIRNTGSWGVNYEVSVDPPEQSLIVLDRSTVNVSRGDTASVSVALSGDTARTMSPGIYKITVQFENRAQNCTLCRFRRDVFIELGGRLLFDGFRDSWPVSTSAGASSTFQPVDESNALVLVTHNEPAGSQAPKQAQEGPDTTGAPWVVSLSNLPDLSSMDGLVFWVKALQTQSAGSTVRVQLQGESNTPAWTSPPFAVTANYRPVHVPLAALTPDRPADALDPADLQSLALEFFPPQGQPSEEHGYAIDAVRTRSSRDSAGPTAGRPALEHSAIAVYDTEFTDCTEVYRFVSHASLLTEDAFLALGPDVAQNHLVGQHCGASPYIDETIMRVYAENAGQDARVFYVMLRRDGDTNEWPGDVVQGRVLVPANPFTGAGIMLVPIPAFSDTLSEYPPEGEPPPGAEAVSVLFEVWQLGLTSIAHEHIADALGDRLQSNAYPDEARAQHIRALRDDLLEASDRDFDLGRVRLAEAYTQVPDGTVTGRNTSFVFSQATRSVFPYGTLGLSLDVNIELPQSAYAPPPPTTIAHPSPAPSTDAITRVFSVQPDQSPSLLDAIQMMADIHAQDPVLALDEVRLKAPKGTVNVGKLVSQSGSKATRWVTELFKLPPEIAAASIAASTGVGFFASLEHDVALETIFVGREEPTSELWSRVGVVVPEDVLVLSKAYFVSETEIRGHAPIYVEGPFDNPRLNQIISFENDAIYYIKAKTLDLAGREFGDYSFLVPEEDDLWEIFVLNTDHRREALVDAFIQNHLLWQSAEDITQALPEYLREAWLNIVALAIRSVFTLNDAERLARAGGHLPGSGLGERGLTAKQVLEPFFYFEKKTATPPGADAPKNKPKAPLETLPASFLQTKRPSANALWAKAAEFGGPAIWGTTTNPPGHVIIALDEAPLLTAQGFQARLATASDNPNGAHNTRDAIRLAKTLKDQRTKGTGLLPILVDKEEVRLYNRDGTTASAPELTVNLHKSKRDALVQASAPERLAQLELIDLQVFVLGSPKRILSFVRDENLAEPEYRFASVKSGQAQRTATAAVGVLAPVWPQHQTSVEVANPYFATYFVDRHGAWDALTTGWSSTPPTLEQIWAWAHAYNRVVVWGETSNPPGHAVIPRAELRHVDINNFKVKLATKASHPEKSPEAQIVSTVLDYAPHLVHLPVLVDETTIRPYKRGGYLVSKKGLPVHIDYIEAKALLNKSSGTPWISIYEKGSQLFYMGSIRTIKEHVTKHPGSYQIVAITSSDSGRTAFRTLQSIRKTWPDAPLAPWLEVAHPRYPPYFVDQNGQFDPLRHGWLPEAPSRAFLIQKAKDYSGPVVYGLSHHPEGHTVVRVRDLAHIKKSHFEPKMATAASHPDEANRTRVAMTGEQIKDHTGDTWTTLPILWNETKASLFHRDGTTTNIEVEVSATPIDETALFGLSNVQQAAFQIHVPQMGLYLSGQASALAYHLDTWNIGRDAYRVYAMTSRDKLRTARIAMEHLGDLKPKDQTSFQVWHHRLKPYYVDADGEFDPVSTGWMARPPTPQTMWDMAKSFNGPAVWGRTKNPPGHSVIPLRYFDEINLDNFAFEMATASKTEEAETNSESANKVAKTIVDATPETVYPIPILLSTNDPVDFDRKGRMLQSPIRPHGVEGEVKELGPQGHTKESFRTLAATSEYPLMQVRTRSTQYFLMPAHLAEFYLNAAFLGEGYFVEYVSAPAPNGHREIRKLARYIDPTQDVVEVVFFDRTYSNHYALNADVTFEDGTTVLKVGGQPLGQSALQSKFDTVGFHMIQAQRVDDRAFYLIKRTEAPDVMARDQYTNVTVTATEYDHYLRQPYPFQKHLSPGTLLDVAILKARSKEPPSTKQPQTKSTETQDETYTIPQTERPPNEVFLSWSPRAKRELDLASQAEQENMDLVQATTATGLGGTYIYPLSAWEQARALLKVPVQDVLIAYRGQDASKLAKTFLKEHPELSYVKIRDDGVTKFWSPEGERIYPSFDSLGDATPKGEWLSDLFFQGTEPPDEGVVQERADHSDRHMVVVHLKAQNLYVTFPTRQGHLSWNQIKSKGPHHISFGVLVNRDSDETESNAAIFARNMRPHFGEKQDYIKVIGGTKIKNRPRFVDKHGTAIYPYTSRLLLGEERIQLAVGYFYGTKEPSDAEIKNVSKALDDTSMVKAFHVQKGVYSVYPAYMGMAPLAAAEGPVRVEYVFDTSNHPEHHAAALQDYFGRPYLEIRRPKGLPIFLDKKGSRAYPVMHKPEANAGPGIWVATGLYHGTEEPSDTDILEASIKLGKANMMKVYHPEEKFYSVFPTSQADGSFRAAKGKVEILYLLTKHNANNTKRKLALQYSSYFENTLRIRDHVGQEALWNKQGQRATP